MNHIKYLLLKTPVFGNAVTVMVLSSLVTHVHAQQQTLPGITVSSYNGVWDLIDLVLCQIAFWMFWILMALSIVFVLIAAFKYLTSAGDPSKVSDATKTIAFAAVAIIVALIAKGFPYVIISLFPNSGANLNLC